MYERIIEMIEKKEFTQALNEVEKIEDEKWEKYNLNGLIYFYQNELEKSKKIFEKGLEIEPINSDLLFNYSHVLLSLGEKMEAWRYLMRIHEKDWAVYDILGDIEFKNRSKASAIKFYKKAYDLNKNEEMAKKLLEKRKSIKKNEKIAFFCLPGLETFIKPIAEELAYEYDVRLIISKEEKEIKKGIDWADIVWIEWANELAIYITNKFNLTGKFVINRLHSYEVLNNYPLKINWGFIDKLVFVSNHIKDMFFEEFKIKIDYEIIENGIDLDKYKYKNRKKGYNLCSIAHINYKKSPDMWIELINKLTKFDIHYNMEVAGDIQDKRFLKYFDYIINENNLDNNFKLKGWIEEIEEFLEDKNYIISTSIHESFGYNIAEAMARGIKPIIRNFRGAKEIWPKKLIFNTIDEAIEKIMENNYYSESYREHIENNFCFEQEIKGIEILFKKMKNNKKFSYSNYWNNRLDKKFDIEGVGYIGLGKLYNSFLYKQREDILIFMIKKIFNNVLNNVNVLEFGPGIGYYTKIFKNYEVNYYRGIDISKKSIEEMNKKFDDFDFINGNVNSINNYGDKKYNLIFGADVLLHITNEKDFLTTISNVSEKLKNNGYGIFMEPVSFNKIKNTSEHFVIRSYDYYYKILGRYGLKIDKILPVSAFMNCPFDSDNDVFKKIFNAISAIFSNEKYDLNIKKDIGNWLLNNERAFLITNNKGFSQKIIIISKKGTENKINDVKYSDIFNLNNVQKNIDKYERILKEKDYFNDLTISNLKDELDLIKSWET